MPDNVLEINQNSEIVNCVENVLRLLGALCSVYSLLPSQKNPQLLDALSLMH